jgi:endonuclease/exonuclease/phosphatase family metal-dependent hydrolase
MKIITWNISYFTKYEPKIKLLKNKVLNDSFIIILQEVKQNVYSKLLKDFKDHNVSYSLNIRKPGKYDTGSRKLGVVIITSNDFVLLEERVYERALLPDRTLFVRVKKGNKEYKVLGLHSITGVDHKKAKSIQFYSFAEAIDELKPDIVGIDANEPNLDTYDIDKTVFHDNKDKGEGAKTFFKVLSEYNLVDNVKAQYKKPISKEYIIPSVKLSTVKYKRYDYLFVNFKIMSIKYLMDEALKAGSDHALVVVDK